MRLAFGACVLDTGQRALWRADEPVHLAPKAFQLLELLVERRPNAVAQKEIYDALWPETIVDLANLHNLVSQVRAAIGDDDHSVVRTVYGFGFAFAAEQIDESARSPFALLVGEALYPLHSGTNVVGRSVDVDVGIFDPSISRRHSRIVVTDTDLTIEDAGSRNGTFIDRERITGTVRVSPGDVVRFGAVAARLISEDAETEAVKGDEG